MMHRLTRTVLSAIIISMTASCTVFRALKHGNATIEDYTKYDRDTIKCGDFPFQFADKAEGISLLDTLQIDYCIWHRDTILHMSIDRDFEMHPNIKKAVIVIRNDTILYENYSKGWDKDTRSTIFSLSKTVTALMCGIAIKEGYIKSSDDAVTDYIPELKDCDPMFSKLKITHLLDMTAGLDFAENYGFNPFSRMARLYLNPDTFKEIRKVKFKSIPGENYHYDSMTTAILGLVIERATGVSYAEWLSEKVWKPLGMEHDALISLDSRKSGIAKAYGGIASNVRDLAKIARLYLNHGNWNGKQIVDSSFTARSLSTNIAGTGMKGLYSYSWYWGFVEPAKFPDKESMAEHYAGRTDVEYTGNWYFNDGEYQAILHKGGFWGFGLYGQVLYVNPRKNLIGIYLGSDRIEDYHRIFDRISDFL